MVPTIGFILCAYLIYALLTAVVRRAGRKNRLYHPIRRRRLTLVSGAGVGAGFLLLIAIAVLPAPSQNFRYAGMISPLGGEDLLGSGRKQARQEIPPLKSQDDPGRPIYAYLHPETPPAQLTPEKGTPVPRPIQRQRVIKTATPAKAPKAVARVPKTDKDREKNKTAHKNRSPQKKPSNPTGNLTLNSG